MVKEPKSTYPGQTEGEQNMHLHSKNFWIFQPDVLLFCNFTPQWPHFNMLIIYWVRKFIIHLFICSSLSFFY